MKVFAKFVSVGFVSSLLGWVLWNLFRYLILLINSSMSLQDVAVLANIPGTLITYIFAYFVNKNIVFDDKHNTYAQAVKFGVLSFSSFIIATSVLYRLSTFNTNNNLILNQLIYVCGVAVGLLINFSGQKYWVFKK